ncbi:hypothetical protein Tco_0177982 [Tanacetum coccineum]
MASQDARLSKFEADFKQQQSKMTNKIDTVLKAITDRITGALPSDTVKNPKLSTSSVLSARSYPTEDPQCSTHIHGSINTITIHHKQQNDSRDGMAKEEEQEREGDPENTNTIACIEERRDTPLLEQKDIAIVGNLGSNKDDEGIEWLDIEEPLDLVDTSEESVYESLIKEMPKCSLNYDFRIKKGDPRNLKIPCIICRKFTTNAYINVDLPMNIMFLAYYNSIRKNGYEYRGRNFVGLGRDMHVFVRNVSYVIDFTILENIDTNIDPSLSHVIFGRPFIEIACLAINRKHGLMTFTDGTKEITFKTPYKDPKKSELSSEGHDLLSSRVILSEDDYDRGRRKPSDLEDGFYKDTIKLGPKYVTRMDGEGEVTFYAVLSSDLTNKILCIKFLIKNEEEIFTDAGDGVRIYPDGVVSPAINMNNLVPTGLWSNGMEGFVPEEPEQAPPSPIYIPFVPEPVYRSFLTKSDPEEEPEEDDEEDPEEDPADYPADRGDDDDDDDTEEEEHLAPADPTAVAYSADQDPYLAYRVTARMSIRHQAPAPFLSEEVAERLLALPTPPPSPLSPYSSPLPQIPSPPLPISSPPPNGPTYAEGSLGSRAAGIRQRDALPVHETEMPEMCLPLRKRPCRTTPGPGYEVGESSAAGAARQFGPTTAEADLYGFTDMLEATPGRRMSRELGYGIRDTWDDLVGGSRDCTDHSYQQVGSDWPYTDDCPSDVEEARLSRAACRHGSCYAAIRQQTVGGRREYDLLKADYGVRRQLVETLNYEKPSRSQMIRDAETAGDC